MHYVPDRPDEEEEEPMLFCDECNGDIYEGDEIFKIDGDNICKGDGCLEAYFGHSLRTVERGGLA